MGRPHFYAQRACERLKLGLTMADFRFFDIENFLKFEKHKKKFQIKKFPILKNRKSDPNATIAHKSA